MLKTASKPVDVQDLHFKLQSRLKIFNKEDGILRKTPTNLLASASRFGLVFVGCNSAILKVFRFENIEDKSSTKTTTTCPRREICLSSQPHNICVNCDDTLLAVVVKNNDYLTVTFYDVLSFYKENILVLNEIRLSNVPGLEILQANWHPTINNIFTECKSDGTLGVYELRDKSFDLKTLPAESKACCFCWSPKGKQIAVGSQDGKIIHYKPDLKAVKSIDAPPFDKRYSVLSLQWISNYQFVAVYKTCQEPDPECNVVVIDAPKAGNTVFTNFYDICYSNGDARPPQFYMITEQHWNILLVSSANSMEVAVMSNTGETWTQCILPDSARAELPLDENQDETFPLGMTVDISSVKPVLWGESYLQPAPSLLLLSHDGVLCSFRMINLKEGAPSLNSPPERVGDLSGLKFFVVPEGENVFEKADSSDKRVNPAVQPSTPVQEQPSQSAPLRVPNQTVSTTPQASHQPTTPLSTFNPITTTPKQTLPTNLFGGQISLTPIRGGKDAQPPTSAAAIGAALLSNTSVNDNRGVNMAAIQRKLAIDNFTSSGMVADTASLSTNLNTPDVQISVAQLPTSSSLQTTTQKTTIARKEIDEQESIDIDNMLEKMVRMESASLDKEIQDLIKQGQNLGININDEEMDEIVGKTEDIKEFLKELVETCEIQSSEIHSLKQTTIQSWAWLEEARSRYRDTQDDELRSLMKSKPLDSVSEKHLSSLKQMKYYLSSQLDQCHKSLDDQWDRFQDYCRKTNRIQMPTMEAIFQTMVKQNAILQKHSYILKDVKSQIKGKQKTSNRAALFNPLDKKDSLENSFNNMKLEPESINHIYHQKVMNRVKSLPANKTNQLRRMLHNREVPHVMAKSQMSSSLLNSTLGNTMKTPIGKRTESVQKKISEGSPLNITSAPKISSTPLSAFANNITPTGKTQSQAALFSSNSERDQNSLFKTPANKQQSQGPSLIGNRNVSSTVQNLNVIKPSPSGESVTPIKETGNLFRTPTSAIGTSLFTPTSQNNFTNSTLASSNLPSSTFSFGTPKSTAVTSLSSLNSSGTGFGNNLSSKPATGAPTIGLSSSRTAVSLPVSSSGEINKEVVPKTTSSIFGSASSFSFQGININKQNPTSVSTITNSASVQSSTSTASLFVASKPTTTTVQSIFGSSSGQSIFVSTNSASNGALSLSTSAGAQDGRTSSTGTSVTSSSIFSSQSTTSAPSTTTIASLFSTSVTTGGAAASTLSTGTTTTNAAPITASIFSFSASTGGLFGTTTTSQSTPPVSTSSSSIFGSSASLFAGTLSTQTKISTTSTTSVSTSSIFGSSTPSGGTFGVGQSSNVSSTSSTKAPNTSSSVFNTPVSSSGGIFGGNKLSSTLTSDGTSKPSTPLFGTSVSSTGSIFGVNKLPSSVTSDGTTKPSTSLLGSSISSTGSIFGVNKLPSSVASDSTTKPSTSPLFGTSVSSTGSIFGVNKLSSSLAGDGTTKPNTSPLLGTSVPSSGSIFGVDKPTSSLPGEGTTKPSASLTSTPVSSIFGTSTPAISTSASPSSNSGSIFGVNSTATSGTPVQSSSSIFGTPVSGSGSIFGVSQSSNAPSTGTTSIFGSSSGGGVFGGSATTTASGTSVFGAAVSSSGGIFASNPAGAAPSSGSIFGTSGMVPATTKSVFGTPTTTSVFGVKQETASSSTSIFGQPAAGGSIFGSNKVTFGASTTSAFGGTAASTAPFGGTTSTASVFGSTVTSTAAFGAATNTASAFGGTVTSTAPFGGSTSTPSAFGASPFDATSTASSPFGNAQSTFGTSSSAFGGTTPNVCSPFGTTQTFGNNQASPFGQSSVFGTTSSPGSAFGTPKPTESSFGFGSLNVGGAQSPFGKPSENKSPFGSTSFGGTASSGSLFGSSNNSSVFRQSAFGGATSFGGAQQQSSSGPFSGGGGSIAQSGFGVSQQSSQAAPGFGAAPSFGGTPAFGVAPTFGGAPAFGSTSPFGSPSKVFGSASPSASTGSAFGSFNQQQSSGFGSFGSQNSLGFGNLAQQSNSPNENPGFGTFASQNTIGFGNLAQQTGSSAQNTPFSGTSSFSSWR